MITEASELPTIPSKRYFTISEASNLCNVEAHVLRYWEQEFSQLSPIKRRGNRRYYQRHDVLLIRQIRSLLYEQGYTIEGARKKLLGDDVSNDNNLSSQLVNQLVSELEDVLTVLKKD